MKYFMRFEEKGGPAGGTGLEGRPWWRLERVNEGRLLLTLLDSDSILVFLNDHENFYVCDLALRRARPAAGPGAAGRVLLCPSFPPPSPFSSPPTFSFCIISKIYYQHLQLSLPSSPLKPLLLSLAPALAPIPPLFSIPSEFNLKI